MANNPCNGQDPAAENGFHGFFLHYGFLNCTDSIMILRRLLSRLLPALLFTFVVYLLSYPAFLMWQYGYRRPVFTTEEGCTLVDMNDPYVSNHSHVAFVPVEQLIDSTALYEPMLLWAKIFGSSDKMWYDSFNRRLSQRLGTPISRTAFIQPLDYTDSSSETWASLTEKRKLRMLKRNAASVDP